jgi:ABC-type uncharacterized transport system permease subunit
MELLFWMVLAGYGLSWLFYFLNFEIQKEFYFNIAKKILITCLGLHFFLILGISATPSWPATQRLEVMVPFVILILSFVMEWKYRARFLTLFSLPVTLLLTLFALWHARPALGDPAWTSDAWFWMHIGFMFMGLAGFVTALSSAMMYLLQSSQLKSRHPGKTFLTLPALDTLDKIHFRSLVGGVILFSLGILSGLYWATDLQKLSQIIRDPKVLLSLLTCFLYWLIVGLRISALRRGQKIAVGTLVVFLLLFTTMMSSYYAPSSFHRGS